MYGLKIIKIDGEYCLHIEDLRRKESDHIYKIFRGWQQAEKLEKGEITQEEYDHWRYYYPKYDTSQIWAKVPSQKISDMIRAFKDRLKED